MIKPLLQLRTFRSLLLSALLLAGFALAAQAATPSATAAARHNNLGTALMNQQLLQKAVNEFDQAYAADPSLAIAKLNQGLALYYLQKLPEAEAALDLATRLLPNDPHAWYVRGLLARSENKTAQATAAFEHVLALDPNDADTHYFLGTIALEGGDLPQAIDHFHRALAINPLHASAQFGLARSLQRQGKPDEARLCFTAFQHITGAKLGWPISHVYGEEGRYAHAEDAALTTSAVPPPLPVTFAVLWHSSPDPGQRAAPACTLLLDGKMTLVAVGSGSSAVQLLQPVTTAGTLSFTPLAATGLPAQGNAQACAAGDYDNDGQTDLALAVDGSVRLFHNTGHAHFAEVTTAAQVEAANHPTSLTFVDFDHDGDLDLFVTGDRNVLLRNNGNGTFTGWTSEAGLGGSSPTVAAAISDLNNDRAIDLITAGTGTPVWYRNRREGAFAVTPLFAARLSATTSIATVDYDKDGWPDILLTHAGAPGLSLWHNLKGKGFERVALPVTGALSGTAATPVDFDNDGWIDIAAVVETTSGPRVRMLRNLGPDGFADVSAQLGLDHIAFSQPGSLIAADFTGSGAASLMLTEQNGDRILLGNRGGEKNHQLRIQLQGLADNRSGVGTKVEIFANGLWQKWEAGDQPEILAGLGAADHPDLIRLLWPTGVPQDEIIDSSTGPLTRIEETDRRGSSCPTLFAWDGHTFNFVTDVIGAGVVGHWVAPNQHNIPDPDEWVKVSGDQLKEQHGFLSLRFGEPMEEVNFVDQVRLVAIDHPASTSVYPNEGFLSEPPFARAQTIAAASAHPLAAAHDAKGDDVLALLSAPLKPHPEGTRPANSAAQLPAPHYVRDFTNLPFAGFANMHTLTLDLGPYTPNAPLRLLLHGFVEYFSASSMYSAWQAGIHPVPPRIEAQAADHSWQLVTADMGFPAGLPRTVVVDLTGKLPPQSRMLRITTNLQIYWDQILVDNEAASGPRAPQLRTTELPLSRATLAFRGYPRQNDGHTPGDLTYDYQAISATGPFLPHRGAYTRFGDVTPLLRSVDDQAVIFGTGEDMDLEFGSGVLQPLPAGWTRDFFFYANGFVKDMDFYEASPFQVGLLPFHGMSAYPYPESERFPEDPAHIAYQLEYNTRWEPGLISRPFTFNYQPTHQTPELPSLMQPH